MRIGFISTYPPIECGIATYTQYLTEALRGKGADVYIVSHIGGAGPQVFPTFDYEDGDLAEKAFSAMIRFTPDVVHIRHEFGLYGKHYGVSVIPLILQFQLLGIPVVTTLHTVYQELGSSHRLILDSILHNSNRVVVHEKYQHRVLSDFFPADLVKKIHTIPHGARLVDPIPDAKRRLGLPSDRKVILLIGYIRPSKNFELIVDIFPEILKLYPKALLVMAGKTRGQEFVEYRNILFERIASSPAKDSIVIIRGQLPQQVFDTVLAAADVVALPYKIVSQSGILAHCLSFGRPLVTSRGRSLADTIGLAGAGVVCGSRSEFIEQIVRLLSDGEFAKRLSENGRRFVRNTISWPMIAEKHLEIYKEITGIPNLEIRIISTR